MKKLFVGNLSWKATEDLLRQEFEQHGNVVSVKIITDPYTGKSKGFGFVEMDSADGAQAAIRELNDKPMLDRNMRVSLAQERTDRDRGERRDYSSPRPSSGPSGGGMGRGGERSSYGKPRRDF
jgi:RNA recognition motif-containing protein